MLFLFARSGDFFKGTDPEKSVVTQITVKKVQIKHMVNPRSQSTAVKFARFGGRYNKSSACRVDLGRNKLFFAGGLAAFEVEEATATVLSFVSRGAVGAPVDRIDAIGVLFACEKGFDLARSLRIVGDYDACVIRTL